MSQNVGVVGLARAVIMYGYGTKQGWIGGLGDKWLPLRVGDEPEGVPGWPSDKWGRFVDIV